MSRLADVQIDASEANRLVPRNRSVFLREFGLLLVVVALAVPIIALARSNLAISLMTQAAIAGLFATSIGFLMRQSGAVSFGNAAFYGAAAYCFALIVKAGFSPTWGILLAIAFPTVLAFLSGLVIVRVPGIAFSMLTLALGQALNEFALKARWLTGGEDGFSIALSRPLFGLNSSVFQDPSSMFVLSWSALAVIIFGLSQFSRSRFGQVLSAIRENEERARFAGYHTVVRRAAAFAVSAFVASIAGILATLHNSFVSPELLHWSVSGTVLIMTIVGGVQYLWGPAVGAVFIFFAKDFAGEMSGHWQAIVGVILIIVTVAMPVGISGAIVEIASRCAALVRSRVER